MTCATEISTLQGLLDGVVDRFPQNRAVVFPDHEMTYGDLRTRSLNLAGALTALGVGAGDKVGILMPNCPEYIALLFGIWMLGAVGVPINIRYRTEELTYIIPHADVCVLVTTDLIDDHIDFTALLNACYPELREQGHAHPLRLAAAPMLDRVVMLGRRTFPGMLSRGFFLSLTDSVDMIDPRGSASPDDIALIMYTSGTTARPKGCLLSHKALVRNGAAAADRLEIKEEDRVWDPLPLFHMAAILPMVAAFSTGASYLSMTHFEPGVALEMMEREKATVAYPAFETITQAILDHPRFPDADLSSLRLILNVATPDRLREMQQRLPQAVQVSAYGCTEGGGVISYNSPSEDLASRLTTTGPPFEGIEVKILNSESGAPVLLGEEGEIVFRGYSLFDGYHKDTESTMACLDAEGWFHSGDLGTLNAAGNISYRGRRKDMLKVGGENVAAAEVENYLARHPAVKIVQVVGVPDDRLNEVVAAFIELRDGSSLTEEDIITFCQGRIARFKIPKYVRFVTQWPMSATKIQKFRLRESLIREVAGSSLPRAVKNQGLGN